MKVDRPFVEICGGVTAPAGFVAASVYCGIKESNKRKPDIALIYSPVATIAAATFTTNKVKAAPVRVSAAHLRNADIRAIVANSGNANACTGLTGIEHAKRMVHGHGEHSGLTDLDGRIGLRLADDAKG